ncbi:MAG: VWA domain-containing protein [Gemmatimonadota bacterium]|nr:VWA domain-containing protein [bacterium]MDE2875750.1 VWA domain-containing protein [Gemmatimonadota bacterium]
MFRFGDGVALWALVLLPLLAGLYWYASRRRQALLDRFGEHALVRKLRPAVSVTARRWKAALVVAAVALLAFSLARPQFGTRVETLRRQGQDVIVALDVSRSMYAEDIAPNRLERAKIEVGRIIQRLDGDRIGLVAFAGDAFVQSPLTADYGAAMMFLSAMDPESMSTQGTDLARAIEVSIEALAETPPENRIVVVVTDGEDHEGGLAEALVAAGEAEVTIHTVGVGSVEGVPLPDVGGGGGRFRRDDAGNVITTRLNEGALQDVALQTGGEYHRIGRGVGGLGRLVERIEGGGREVESREVTQYEEQYQIFLGAALLLLALEFIVPGRRRRTAGRPEIVS